MLLWLAFAGCTLPVTPCESNVDCAGAFGVGWTCGTQGVCVEPTGTTTAESADTSDRTDQGKTDSDTGTKPITPVIIINEVLYDPSNDQADKQGMCPKTCQGDANGDGVYIHDNDEFVEFVNISGATADISGYRLYDDEFWTLDEPRHTVPEGTLLAPGQAFVVFGGGKPTGKFGGAVVQTATSGAINMNNSNDMLRVVDAAGRLVATFDVTARSNNPNESYTRNPDLTGLFEQHASNTSLLFSPGTKVDGTSFR